MGPALDAVEKMKQNLDERLSSLPGWESSGGPGGFWAGGRMDCILICFTSDQSCSGAAAECGATTTGESDDLSRGNWIKILTNRSARLFCGRPMSLVLFCWMDGEKFVFRSLLIRVSPMPDKLKYGNRKRDGLELIGYAIQPRIELYGIYKINLN